MSGRLSNRPAYRPGIMMTGKLLPPEFKNSVRDLLDQAREEALTLMPVPEKIEPNYRQRSGDCKACGHSRTEWTAGCGACFERHKYRKLVDASYVVPPISWRHVDKYLTKEV